MTISIYESSDGDGFFYDIFDRAPEDVEDLDPLDGGFCTTTMENALGMAMAQALEIIQSKKEDGK